MSAIDTTSGLMGAFACTYTGMPFDVAKVRLQSGMYSYRGTFDCLFAILRTEGVRAWYRGFVPALSSSIAENTTGVTVQRALRRQLAASGHEDRFGAGTEVAIGAVTGICTCVIMNPFEVVKTRMQVHDGKSGGQVIAEARAVLADGGVHGLFRGLGALWARDIPFNACFYGAYETITTGLMRSLGARSRDDLSSAHVCFAGGAAGVVGWSVVLPFDVVKTQLQCRAPRGSVASSVAKVLVEILRREGVPGLYHGWWAAVMRAFPANAAMFLGVETTDRVLRKAFGAAAQ